MTKADSKNIFYPLAVGIIIKSESWPSHRFVAAFEDLIHVRADNDTPLNTFFLSIPVVGFSMLTKGLQLFS